MATPDIGAYEYQPVAPPYLAPTPIPDMGAYEYQPPVTPYLGHRVSVKGPARFERWELCDVCGFSFAVSELKRDQWGRLHCPDCDDKPSNEDYQNEDTPTASRTKPPWPEA